MLLSSRCRVMSWCSGRRLGLGMKLSLLWVMERYCRLPAHTMLLQVACTQHVTAGCLHTPCYCRLPAHTSQVIAPSQCHAREKNPQISNSILGTDKNGTLGFCEFLGPGCINIKNLCAHHQEEVLRIPDSKTPPTYKFCMILSRVMAI